MPVNGSGRPWAMMDGNEAVTSVAYRLNEVIAIYPITPSSGMAELADVWSAEGKPNLWGAVPSVVEMQSEAGAAGALHGALQAGSLATTFTSSQGLLLMIPNMFKMAGELTPTVIHVASRTVATHALSIFGDHSDVMAVRTTGFALLASGSVQEAHDLACIAQAAALKSRVPFLHFFDGFRTSHEVASLHPLSDEELRAMVGDADIHARRARALSPDHPVLRGTAQNPDVYFQAREAVSPFYAACPDLTQALMDQFAQLVGRAYRVYEYVGAPDATRVVVLMGSGCDTVQEVVGHLAGLGEKVGLVRVRLYRPFDVKRFVQELPATTEAIAVLDRTKEPGAIGEPLCQDVVGAITEGFDRSWTTLHKRPRVIGGRYGLSSKEFTPAMAKAVFDHLKDPRGKNSFTVGIMDDVSRTNLWHDPEFSLEPTDRIAAVLYGLSSDGTVGANKNAIKIIGDRSGQYAQGYFVYDSRKSGTMTTSHLRFGREPIHSPYLISRANLVACHHEQLLERHDVLQPLTPGGTFMLNTPHAAEDVWAHLPPYVQEELLAKRPAFYVINADAIAHECSLGRRINTVMQVAFFAVTNVIPLETAIADIKTAIETTYRRKGAGVVEKNLRAVDLALAKLAPVRLPDRAPSSVARPAPVPEDSPDFVRHVIGPMLAGRGDELPVSAMPVDGTFPVGTSKWEKRNLAEAIPVWDSALCIQCGKCSLVCPHSAIRMKVYDPNALTGAPATFKSCAARDREWMGQQFTIQVSPMDCTGCMICVDICPARDKTIPDHKALDMTPQAPLREAEHTNWEFFLQLPYPDRQRLRVETVRQQQLQQPLFEFSGACAGCGETPYIKLLTQLFGDRLLIANATGCSSIFGGNLPTAPWTVNAEGRGPAWCNSLFEDNAEFGFGIRVSLDHQREHARALLAQLAGQLDGGLAEAILAAPQRDEADVHEQRLRVVALTACLQTLDSEPARRLLDLTDLLARKSVWIIGGDGWAYDIGFGGLDHVLASGSNVKVLVLDTEVYSNTGGQMSKATPRGAVAKFAASGKRAAKKDLGLMAMTYGNIYVASVAMGARDEHTLRAFLEAEAYDGPALIIAYSHCIAHGMEMSTAMRQQRTAVDSGYWLLYRFNPERAKQGHNPLTLDAPAPTKPIEEYLKLQTRFLQAAPLGSEALAVLFKQAQADAAARRALYESLAAGQGPSCNGAASASNDVL